MLVETGTIVKYNNIKDVKKQRRVDHVRWFESMQEGVNSNKFIVVFDDGTLYVFFRTLAYEERKLDEVIRIPVGAHQNPAQVY